MFAEEISLWTGGPVLTLGDYFIALRYLLAVGLLLCAAAVFRWPRPGVLLGGSLLVAALGWLALDFPLGRPYGLKDGGVVLEELAEPMVVAATGSPSMGAVVGESNAFPFWSLVVALASGLDPERLLALYRFVPLLGIAALSLAAYGALDALGYGRPAALGVFFVLFLGVPRLAFLESETLVWTDLFGLRPRIAFGLALSLLAFRGFATAEKARDFLLAGIILGVSGWIEPRALVLGGAGVVGWSLLSWRGSAWIGLGAALALYLLWPATGIAPQPLEESVTWHGAVQRLFSVTLDQGAVFYLAVFAVIVLVRERRKESLLLVSWIASAYVSWIVVSLSDDAALLLDRGIVKAFLRVLLAAGAGLGAGRLLVVVDDAWKRRETPELLRGRSLQAVGLALIPLLALPWVFPFWWNPVRMDAVYRESFEAISREHLAFGEWIRESTPEDAVFLAGPSYAAWIPALTGRRVLSGDETDPERKRAREWIAASRDPEKIRSASERWGVTHVAWGRLDAGDPLAIDFEFLESSPLFSLVHQQRRWVRVFEIRRPN